MEGLYLSYEVITIMGKLKGTMYTPTTEKNMQINEIFVKILEDQRSWIARNTIPTSSKFKVRLFYADKSSFNRLMLLESRLFNCEFTFNEIPKTPIKVDFNGETKWIRFGG